MKVTLSCLALWDCIVHGILQARILEWVAFPFSRGSSQCRWSNPGLPHCRQILYQLSHQGKPKNTGVGSLSPLQWIILTQELNQGLLHCRQILYQLSYQGNPKILKWSIKNNCSSKFSLKHSYYYFFIFANIQREMTVFEWVYNMFKAVEQSMKI